MTTAARRQLRKSLAPHNNQPAARTAQAVRVRYFFKLFL
jgi:hypothetical protein